MRLNWVNARVSNALSFSIAGSAKSLHLSQTCADDLLLTVVGKYKPDNSWFYSSCTNTSYELPGYQVDYEISF